jgi:ATP-binding cassette, subfamily B, bacterial
MEASLKFPIAFLKIYRSSQLYGGRAVGCSRGADSLVNERHDGRSRRPIASASEGYEQDKRMTHVSLHRLLAGVRGTAVSALRVLGLVWRTHAPLTAALATLTLVRSAVPVAEVWLTKLLIDAVVRAIQNGGMEAGVRQVAVLAGAQFTVVAAGSFFRALSNISQQLLQERVSIRIQLLIMEQANRLDLAAFEDPRFYDQVQQVQRESTYRPVQMVAELFGLVRTLLTFFAMVALLARLGPLIALVSLASPVPAFIASSRYGWHGFQLMRRQSPLRRLMGYLTTVLTTDSFNKEVKVFTLGPYFVERYRGLAEQYYHDVRGLLIRRYLAGFAWGLLSLLVTSATYLYVALLAVASRITLGDLTLFTRAASQVQEGFQNVLGSFSSMYEHGLYVAILFDLLAHEPQIKAPAAPVPVPRPIQRGIEFRNVSFSHPGSKRPALHNISFTIAPGETVAIVGRNGAGKTTLVKLLARFYDPDSGQVLFDGRDLRRYDPTELRRQIGAIFQDYVDYQLTAAENIGVGKVERMHDEAALNAAAEQGGAAEIIARLPQGYKTVLGKWFDSGHQLSGGEWQKIALARAFMREAQVLILDEPTAALDAEAEYELFIRIRELTRGKTAILISHRFSTVRMADRILVLEGGQLVEQGSHDDLLARNGRYAQLFELQAISYRSPAPIR